MIHYYTAAKQEKQRLDWRPLQPDDLILYDPDIEAVWGQNRFTDCTHEHEPCCAVRQEVESGRIANWRYHNYTNLYTRLLEGEK